LHVSTTPSRRFWHLNDLARAVFQALDKPVDIEYVDTPVDIRNKYQYFTEARMEKLKRAGYGKEFHSIEEGVYKYISII
jgi:ADP-L-glycero-D-manno-heptose 6-epimerase